MRRLWARPQCLRQRHPSCQLRLPLPERLPLRVRRPFPVPQPSGSGLWCLEAR